MDGHIADRHGAERALERAAVCVAVQDEVGPVSADRRGEPRGAEKGPDRLRLTHEGLRDGRVVQQHDADVAARDRLERRLEAGDLIRRLTVDLTQERLAEVG